VTAGCGLDFAPAQVVSLWGHCEPLSFVRRSYSVCKGCEHFFFGARVDRAKAHVKAKPFETMGCIGSKKTSGGGVRRRVGRRGHVSRETRRFIPASSGKAQHGETRPRRTGGWLSTRRLGRLLRSAGTCLGACRCEHRNDQAPTIGAGTIGKTGATPGYHPRNQTPVFLDASGMGRLR